MPSKQLIAQQHSSHEIMEAKKRGDQIVCGICGHEICVISPGDTDGPSGFGPGIGAWGQPSIIDVVSSV